MLLSSIQAVNSKSDVLSLRLINPSDDQGFIVKDIQGLGPVKAAVVSSKFATLDGEQYHSSSRGNRNIIIKLGLKPDYGQEYAYDVRQQLYNIFMPKEAIKLRFFMDNKFTGQLNYNVEIDGVVEYAEPSIFSKDPEFDISVICHDPHFIHMNSHNFGGLSVDDETYSELSYIGNVDSGFVFKFFPNTTLLATPTIPSFTLSHLRPDGLINTIEYYDDLSDGDTVEISTIPGNKYAYWDDGGSPITKMYAVEVLSDWPLIKPGINQFRLNTVGNVVGIPYSIEVYNRYGGL